MTKKWIIRKTILFYWVWYKDYWYAFSVKDPKRHCWKVKSLEGLPHKPGDEATPEEFCKLFLGLKND